MIAAELTPNRKNAQCPECHRLLAVRSREADGRHVLYIDGDWREPELTRFARRVRSDQKQMREIDPTFPAPADDDRLTHVLVRNWTRLEAHGSGSRTIAGPRSLVTTLTALSCGCGRRVTLDPVELNVTLDA